MVALISILVVLLVSLLITRVATLALAMTGMSHESARFQARSALSGVGFTTREAEAVVAHPVRRRIVLILMLLGSAGIVTAVASLIISFGGGSGGGVKAQRAAVLVGGLLLLVILARSRAFDRAIGFVIAPILSRAGLAHRDFATLLDLEGEFAVHELQVEDGDWVADRTLGELALRDEGVMVLGVHRPGGAYVGVPRGTTRIAPGDVMVVYAHADRIAELDDRRRGSAGDREHAAAASTH